MPSRWEREIAVRDAQEAWDQGLKAFVYCPIMINFAKTGAQFITKEVNEILDMGWQLHSAGSNGSNPMIIFVRPET